MRAVVCERGELAVAEVPDLRPGDRQLLVRVSGCGICGSDLHARHHADVQADVMRESGCDAFMRSHERVVLGHEFTGEVVGRGRRTSRKIADGTSVVAMPLMEAAGGMHPTGLSAAAPGGYAEQVLVEEAFTFVVPNGLATSVAALTEPMAVALHAVRRAEIAKREVAVVIGCGPVGLAVICMLKARGVATVVASDPSTARRRLASTLGADVVVDPTTTDPFGAAGERGWSTSMPTRIAAGRDAMAKLRSVPVPWELTFRLLQAAGATNQKRPVVFECVGIPGMIEQVVTSAPMASRIVVVGVCMEVDRFRPAVAINKELDLRFVLGYTPLDFRDTLHMLAEGKVDPTAMVTGTVGLHGVAGAFDDLSTGGHHAKVLIDPRLTPVP